MQLLLLCTCCSQSNYRVVLLCCAAVRVVVVLVVVSSQDVITPGGRFLPGRYNKSLLSQLEQLQVATAVNLPAMVDNPGLPQYKKPCCRAAPAVKQHTRGGHRAQEGV
jgi:hypothetical protein